MPGTGVSGPDPLGGMRTIWVEVSLCTVASVWPSPAIDRELWSVKIVRNGMKRALGIGEQPDLSLDRQMLAAGHVADKDSSSIRRPGISYDDFVGGRDEELHAAAREIKESNLAERFAVQSQRRNRHAFAIGGPGEFGGRAARRRVRHSVLSRSRRRRRLPAIATCSTSGSL